jgi:hypothetical protein
MQGLQSLQEELTIKNAGIVKVHKRSSPSSSCRDLQSVQEKVLKVFGSFFLTLGGKLNLQSRIALAED